MKRILITLSAALLFLGVARPANAAFIINAQQVGSDVVFSGSGSVDLATWTFFSTNHQTGFDIDPGAGEVAFDLSSYDLYYSPQNYSGPGGFGGGMSTFGATGSGIFYFQDISHFLGVPAGYHSKDTFFATMTFSNQTFASLHMNAGPRTYTWSWGSVADGDYDYFKLNVGLPSVPESGSTLLMLGMVVAGYAARRFWK